jgi:hypothetical protein
VPGSIESREGIGCDGTSKRSPRRPCPSPLALGRGAVYVHNAAFDRAGVYTCEKSCELPKTRTAAICRNAHKDLICRDFLLVPQEGFEPPTRHYE